MKTTIKATKQVRIRTQQLQKAIHKLNNKINLTPDFSYNLLRLTLIKSKLKEINKLHLVLLNNKTAVKINLNGLIIAKRKAKIKNVKSSIMDNINFYLNLCEDIQLYKNITIQKYNILVKI